jgi:hypothetical protein
MLTEDACSTLHGTWYDGVTCETTDCATGTIEGRCCTPPNICTVTTQEACASMGGTFTAGADCPDLYTPEDPPCPVDPTPYGACCIGANCSYTNEAACDFAGGLWYGNQDCADVTCGMPSLVGACCKPDGSCVRVMQADCNALAGYFWGVGTTCDVNKCVGRCCVGNPPVCKVMNLVQCGNLGGTFSAGQFCNVPVPCNLPTLAPPPIFSQDIIKEPIATTSGEIFMQDDDIKNNVIGAIESLKQEGVSIQDFDNPEKIEGFGDKVANVLSSFGLTQDYLQTALGFGWGCGCNERKSFLNKIFSFTSSKKE